MRVPVQRRLAAILAADVAGYSRLMGVDEEETLDRLKTLRRELIDPKIEEHHGRLVKTTGDGMLVEFPSVVDAVRCAVELQRAMIDCNAGMPEDRRIVFRIGVNLGDVMIDRGDIYGDGVNIAARLEALAEPGGICVSRAVRNQVRDKLPYTFADMGAQNVKNIARPVRAYGISAADVALTPLRAAQAQPLQRSPRFGRRRALVVAAIIALIGVASAVWWAGPQRPPTVASVRSPAPASAPVSSNSKPVLPSPLSVVVLPFANLSNDPEQEYFADAITDDVTTDLSRISGSFVIAPTTAFTYKGKGVGAQQIGHELGVRYLLNGSVQRTGHHVQVNVQLVDAESDAQLWADRLESDRADLVKGQKEITGRLARTLNLELTEAVHRRAERAGAVDIDAQDLLLRGWALYYRPASAPVRQEALQAFERALELDPGSIDGRIGIGAVLTDNLVLSFSKSREQDTARADEVLSEALERDLNRSMAHFAMGVLRRVQNRLGDSEIELETAIALDRNNARALQQLGLTLMWLGKPETAIPQIEKAIRLNPYDPNIVSYYWALGASKLVSGEIDEAATWLEKARASNPRLFFVHLWLAAPLALRAELDEAKSALAQSIKLRPEISSLARWRSEYPWYANPPFVAIADQTLYAGLRRAGFPEE
jgi:class 3 adenylate cyclase/TolB-like protein/tetratricopeptide (TPR) repeat protein